jgi:hypothetical protein
MNAPPFPTNPQVGSRYQSWVWNGSRWVCSPGGMIVNTQVFMGSGTYSPSAGLVTAVATCVGGGAAGGSAGPATSALQILGGGGGGSGGWSRKTIPAALVLGGVTVSIGAGGTPTDADEYGGSGGPTSFGAFCVAYGGLGGGWNGLGGSANAWGEGGAAASPGIGDLGFPGDAGSPGVSIILSAAQSNAYAVAKGGTIFGGARTYAWGPNQIPGGMSSYPNTGAGGSGALLNQIATGAISQGGVGGSGICWVDEYCWLAGGDGDCGDCGGQARVAYSGWRGHDPFGDS